MTRKIQVHQVDAFTREPFTGNPTGVVLNADGLTEAQMLAIARELNNAETAFILSADGADHTVRARFFTPRSEAGFVGHATVAAQYVLSRRHEAPRRRVARVRPRTRTPRPPRTGPGAGTRGTRTATSYPRVKNRSTLPAGSWVGLGAVIPGRGRPAADLENAGARNCDDLDVL